MPGNLEQLKSVADNLNISYSVTIGAATLKSRIEMHCKQNDIPLDDPRLEGIFAMNAEETTKLEKLKNLTFAEAEKKHHEEEEQSVFKRAMKLVRCQISCNNPNKRDYQGEIFSARNKYIPEVKKFVPFNNPTHVPQILLNMIKEKQLQTFVMERLPNGTEVKRSRLVPEYNIQELPPLTSEEFNAIRQKQLAEGNK